MAPELRQCSLSGEWVVVAPERGARPTTYEPPRGSRDRPAFDPDCPFCPGNEGQTPGTLLRIPERPEEPWRVRVVPNAFPALADDADRKVERRDGAWPVRPGAGRHEVIVEGPDHSGSFEELAEDRILEVLQAYRARFSATASDPRVRHVVIFKNRGETAGASMPHPHAQLIGLPFVPGAVDRVAARAREHAESTGADLLIDLVRRELESGERVLGEGTRFVTYLPYAGASPYEIWIAPREPVPRFDRVEDSELSELGGAVRRALHRLRRALDDPDYNLILQTPPLADNGPFPWYAQIVPRFTSIAGFELGVGLRINHVPPEEAAARLRDADTG